MILTLLELRLMPDASEREDASSPLTKLAPTFPPPPPTPIPEPETDGNINVELVEARDCQDVERVPFQDVK